MVWGAIYWNDAFGLVTDPEPSHKMQVKLQVWISSVLRFAYVGILRFGYGYDFHYCPMPIWTSLPTNIFFVLYCRKRIVLFQPLSHSPFSYLKSVGAHCKKGHVTNTSLARHPLVDRWWSTYTKVHLNSFFEVVLQQRTWALGFKLRMAEVALASPFLQIAPW